MSWRWRWGFILALLGVFWWIHPGMAAKINRVTDKDGTVHISNEGATEPGKPGGTSGPTPIGTLPPQQVFSPPSPPPPPPPEAATPPVAPPPEEPNLATEPPAEPPAPEAGSEAPPVQPPNSGNLRGRGARVPPQ